MKQNLYTSKIIQAENKRILFTIDDFEKQKLKSGDFIIAKNENKKTIGIAFPGSKTNNAIEIGKLVALNLNSSEESKIEIDCCKLSKSEALTINMFCHIKLSKQQEHILTTLIKKIYNGYPFINSDSLEITKIDAEIKNFLPAKINLNIICNDSEFIVISNKTEIKYKYQQTEEYNIYDNIDMYNQLTNEFYNSIIYPLINTDELVKLNIRMPKAVFLSGITSNIKKDLIENICDKYGIIFKKASLSELYNKHYGESERSIKYLFNTSKEKNEPTIIYLENFDTIFQKTIMFQEIDQGIASELRSQLDGIKSSDKIVVIASISDINNVDGIYRTSGRFSYEIRIDSPNEVARYQLLKYYLKSFNIEDSIIKNVAQNTNGYTDADLNDLVFHTTKDKIKNKINIITQEDFTNALKLVKPSVMKEFIINIPKVKLSDVIGLEEAKKSIEESVSWRINPPDILKELKVPYSKGILLYGPPGCGKTMLCQAVANELKCNFLYVKGPEIFSKWLGESYKSIREIFAKAKRAQPCIVFIDEFDSIASRRNNNEDDSGASEMDKVVNQLLMELNGLEQEDNVILIGATNRPDKLDPAVIRTERIDSKIYVGLPNKENRKNIFISNLKEIKHNNNINFDKLSSLTEGYASSDIRAIVKLAGNKVIREVLENKRKSRQIEEDDLINCIKKVKVSATAESLKVYEAFANTTISTTNNSAEKLYS